MESEMSYLQVKATMTLSKCIHQVKAEICENSQIVNPSLERNGCAENPEQSDTGLRKGHQAPGTVHPSASRDVSLDFCYVTNVPYLTGNGSFLTSCQSLVLLKAL